LRRKGRGSARIALKREFGNRINPDAREEAVAAAVVDVCDPDMLMVVLGIADPSVSARTSEHEEREDKTKMSGGASFDGVDTENLTADEKASSLMLQQAGRVEERILTTSGRPSPWDALIYLTVVEAEGETATIACGRRGLMTEIRNYVA
jgi:hypothetical protein